jgi:hypothetical protein
VLKAKKRHIPKDRPACLPQHHQASTGMCLICTFRL